MKRQLLTLVILILFGFAPAQAQSPYDVEVKSIDGQSISLSETLKGEIIILDFWTTWCKPCIRSIPKLVTLSEKYNEKQVQFIGVNEDSPRNVNKVKPMVKSLKIPYTVVLDTEQVLLREMMVRAYPTLLVMNRKGEVLYTHVGFSPGDEVELEQKINEYLKK